jgi:hypothetical protein
MTIGITGPRRRELWRGAVFALILAGIVGAIGLILLGLTDDFLVDVSAEYCLCKDFKIAII